METNTIGNQSNEKQQQNLEGALAAARTVTLPGKKKKGSTGLWIFVGIVGVLLLLAVFLAASGFVGTDDDHAYAVNEPYIATVHVDGEISAGTTDAFGTPMGYQHQWTLEQIDFLISDGNNKGMLLYVNSPGGGVFESDELYLKIKEYQTTTKRPVYAYMGNYAASGGYYVLASADKIIANRNTWTGSIGVKLGSMIDVSGLLERYGIKVTEIASGTNKNMGSMLQPMTEEQKFILQSLVDEAYGTFVDIVAEGTGLSNARVRQLADGRIYSAKQALSVGLVDGIGTYDETMDLLKKENKLNDCTEVNVEYVNESLFGNFFAKLGIGALRSQTGDVGQILKIVETESQYPISYLCDLVR